MCDLDKSEILQTQLCGGIYCWTTCSPVDSKIRLYPLLLPFLAMSYFFNTSEPYVAEAGYVT